MVKSFYKWLRQKVEDENYWVKEEYGIRYYFDEDCIMDVFMEETQIDYKICEEDDYEVLHPLFCKWVKNSDFSWTPSRKDIQERIDEDNAEKRTRSFEMGWGGSFVSDDMGRHTYFDPRDEY
jgi:hypothetical protein